MSNKEYTECPHCKGKIKTGAVKCKHCKSIIDYEKELIKQKPIYSDEHINNKIFIAPIINDPTIRGIDIEYRLETDDENVIRINQSQPKGCPKIVAEFVPVAGITKEKRDLEARKFIFGKERKIELEKEPNNPYDKNAIAVYGHCKYLGKFIECKLGYIPADQAKDLINYEILKATIKTMYYPTKNKNIGIRLDIWSKRKPAHRVKEKYYKDIDIPKNIYDRNLLAIELENKGYIENAIELYELCINENFDGSHPYDRLAIIYRKQKKKDDVIRVLEKAVYVFENIVYKNRADRTKKLDKYKKDLEKAKQS